MFKCLLIKRKLYDYLNKDVTEIEKIRIESHLEQCPNCEERASRMQTILGLISKDAFKPSEEFWANFRADLNRKLDERISPQPQYQYKRSYLKSVLAYSFIFMFFILAGTYFYNKWISPHVFIRQTANLVEEFALLDEVEETVNLNGDEEDLLEEIDLFYELNQES